MKKVTLLAISAFLTHQAYSQAELPPPANYTRSRAITTGVPFLLISADARSAALGDQGVATSPDAYSQQYNPAKYAFAEKQQGFAISYTPYMAKIASDISLAQLNYYNKITERSALAASFRYFGLGEIQKTNDFGNPMGIEKPNEFAFDVSYSIKLSDNFSGGVAARYISSNLQLNEERESKANTFAVDVAGYYESDRMSFDSFDGIFRAGFNFQNLGPKISYTEDAGSESFIPSNLRLGAGFDFILDEFNKVSVYGETTKLLVPTPQEPKFLDLNGDGELSSQEANTAISKNNEEYRKIGWASGIFKSFGDAPGGMSEEIKEFTWALGAEYWYQDSFAFRLGYFNEAEEKGARKYATLGAGFKYNIINVDISYLFSTSKVQNPLDNTLRFSLTFNFGQNYAKY
ncbi:type IX secretion system outer membrane channel protein PorV [Paenimyroides ceti]